MHPQENGGAIAHVLKPIPRRIRSKTSINMDISSMLEVQVNEVKGVDIKENVTPGGLLPRATDDTREISLEEKAFQKNIFSNGVAAVRFGRLHCTGCDTHIGSAPSQAHNMFEHPVLKTLLCVKCREFYGDGTFEQGDDATDMFCRWCANGGNLYCCSYCSNTFCSKCIKRNLGPTMKKNIEADEKWKCFVCDPSPLYTLRAVCWGLLEHIHTVTRIIQNDCSSTPEDIEYKMNLDESTCCPRRRKRKRRRASNSEEEDETYKPDKDGAFSGPRRKIARKSINQKGGFLNGTTSHLLESDVKPIIRLQPSNKSPIPLHPKDEAKDDTENATDSSETTPSSSASADVPKISRINPSTQPRLHNTPILNAVPTARLLKPSAMAAQASGKTFIVPPLQPIRPRVAPMVSIPNQPGMFQRIFITNAVRLAPPKITPNVIEIDSDSDESTAPQSSDTSSPQVATTSVGKDNANKTNTVKIAAVPVALVSSRGSIANDVRPDQPLRERRSSLPRPAQTFNQMLYPRGKEIDFILDTLKGRLHELFESTKPAEFKTVEPKEARLTIKQFHREIRSAVTQLAHVNDRMVREYNKWKRSNSRRNLNGASENNTTITKETTVDIPLDMSCTNESDTESNSCDAVEYNVISPSDLVGETNVVEHLQFFNKKRSIDRAAGPDQPLTTESKCIQITTTELRDYEDSIFYSVVTTGNSEIDRTYPRHGRKSTKRDPRKYENEFLRFLETRKESTTQEESDDVKTAGNSSKDFSLTTSNTPHEKNTETVPNISSETNLCNNNIQLKTHKRTGKEDPASDVKKDSISRLDSRRGASLNVSYTSSSRSNTQTVSPSIKRKTSLRKKKSRSSTSNSTVTNSRNSTGNEEDCTIIDD